VQQPITWGSIEVSLLVLSDLASTPFGCADRPGFREVCVVLSDNDRKSLLDVERQLTAEDPELARLFRDQLRRRPATRGGSNSKIAVSVAMLFSAILLLAGFAAGALTCVIVTGVFWAMWWCSKGSDPKRSHPRAS
jgi:hypothetical protein